MNLPITMTDLSPAAQLLADLKTIRAELEAEQLATSMPPNRRTSMTNDIDMTGAVPLGPFYGEPEPDPIPSRPLSPAAQAVLDASMEVTSGSPPPRRHRECIAAALRSVVEQICPQSPCRARILSIATELESFNG
jgi:hypothetical protein